MKFIFFAAMIFSAMATSASSNPLPPSDLPPGGLSVSEAPQFVSIGFDDNAYSGLPGSGGDGGMTWLTDYFRHLNNPAGQGNRATFDGMPARITFFHTTYYVSQHVSESAKYVRDSWKTADDDGHESANHTQNHKDATALNFDEQKWREEIETNESWMTKPYVAGSDSSAHGLGLLESDMVGLRSPYLHYNNALFTELRSQGYQYDASIEDGWQPEDDGTNYSWPYRLDSGSPGHDYLFNAGIKNYAIDSHPGLTEMPIHPMIIPPDDKTAAYGVTHSIRDRVNALNIGAYDHTTGKITALDYTLWLEAKMTKAEFIATLKYTLDLRLAGNRAPFLLGAHSGEYSPKWTGQSVATTRERQEAIEAFIQYALSKPEVRIRPYKDVLSWMKKPVALGGDFTPTYQLTTEIIGEKISTGACAHPPWVNTQTYTGGATVSYEGRQFHAKWWTQNNLPTAGDPWRDDGACGSTETLYHGSVTPSAYLVEPDQEAIFTITADTGYRLADVVINGVSFGPVNPLTLRDVNEHKQINIRFVEDSEPAEFVQLEVSASIGGTIAPSGIIDITKGADQSFVITPADGFHISGVFVNGVSQGSAAQLTLTSVSANTIVVANFEKTADDADVRFDVSAGPNGSISPDGIYDVARGSTQDFMITPATGYEVESVWVNDSDQGPVTSITIDAVSVATTIVVTFKQQTSPGCHAPWSADTIYLQGDRVSHLNHLWSAKWWTRGHAPAFSGYVEWQDLGPC